MVFQVIKSVVLFGVMYWALKFLGVPEGAALITSTIPLVLGLIGVMTEVAFSIAGLVFVLAAFSALLPAKYHNGMDFVEQVFNSALVDKSSVLTADKTKQAETAVNIQK